MNKYHFIFNKTQKAKILKKKFKRYKNYSLKKCNIIIVAGGDGFMLRVLKKHYKLKKLWQNQNKF